MTVTESPLRWDPWDTEIWADPHPTFARLRDQAPLYRNDEHDFWALSRFDDVERSLKDPATFSSAKGNILELIQADLDLPPGTVIMEDPPTHTEHRKLMSRVFTPRKVAALEPQIRQFCADCLDPLEGAERFDLIEDFGSLMPMRVIGMLMGIPEEDQLAIRDKTDDNLRTEAGQKMDADHEMGNPAFEAYIDYRMENPSDDLMTELIHAEFTDHTGAVRTLTRDELVIYMSVITGAGNETTNRLIGWMGKLLAEYPDQRRDIVENRELIPQAVEETLRCEPPGPSVARYVTTDVELHGQTVPAGSAMLLLVAAANRDERRWTDPDRFDIHREQLAHVTFGYGIHFCLGAALARIQGRIALDELLDRFPEWDVAEGASLSSTSTVRGFESLPIVIP